MSSGGAQGLIVAQPYGGGRLAEVTAFNRSEVAQQIRQSFDALVKASPIGAPLVRCWIRACAFYACITSVVHLLAAPRCRCHAAL